MFTAMCAGSVRQRAGRGLCLSDYTYINGDEQGTPRIETHSQSSQPIPPALVDAVEGEAVMAVQMMGWHPGDSGRDP